MNRFVIALSLTTLVASALPALAGPNGAASFFPIEQRRSSVTRKGTPPHALLGDTADGSASVRAHQPGVMGKYPTRTFLRRPSEGK